MATNSNSLERNDVPKASIKDLASSVFTRSILDITSFLEETGRSQLAHSTIQAFNEVGRLSESVDCHSDDKMPLDGVDPNLEWRMKFKSQMVYKMKLLAFITLSLDVTSPILIDVASLPTTQEGGSVASMDKSYTTQISTLLMAYQKQEEELLILKRKFGEFKNANARIETKIDKIQVVQTSMEIV
nr:hypothetical protein Iba_chr14bCG8680 [Ipomoea batatas]